MKVTNTEHTVINGNQNVGWPNLNLGGALTKSGEQSISPAKYMPCEHFV